MVQIITHVPGGFKVTYLFAKSITDVIQGAAGGISQHTFVQVIVLAFLLFRWCVTLWNINSQFTQPIHDGRIFPDAGIGVLLGLLTNEVKQLIIAH